MKKLVVWCMFDGSGIMGLRGQFAVAMCIASMPIPATTASTKSAWSMPKSSMSTCGLTKIST